MKKPQKMFIAEMSLADLAKAPQGCVWEGCERSTPLFEELPDDWRWMMVGTGSFGWDRLDRDCVLCPKHVSLLESYLKDIGGRLNKTEGSA